MAKLTLGEVPTGKTFIDSSSTYINNELTTYTPEWCVVAHDTDGSGITTLIALNKMLSVPMDAKEPSNPDSNKRDYGNNSYEYSNVLQYLNSDKLAGEWYEAQHEYDQEPIYPYVENIQSYANRDAFLSHFSEDFKEKMRTVTKMGVARKVHLPACNELCNTVQDLHENDIVYDSGTQYGTYSQTGSSQSSPLALFRGSHSISAPVARIYYNTGTPATINRIVGNYTDVEIYPYDGNRFIFPVIYMDSNTPVEYNTTDQKYYAKWDNAPELTVNPINMWQSNAFDIVFKVTDADADSVMVDIDIDSTSIYHSYTSLNTNITVSTSSVFSSLENGAHTITITADDGEKEVSVEKSFSKANVAPNALANIAENKVFVDNNSEHNGQPIEWYIVGKDIDGDGIITLMMKNPLQGYCFDAKEVYNPNSDLATYGKGNYSQSNILQWLNSKGGANEWYSAQHTYDSPPDYANEDGFLHNFSETILASMNEANKFGLNRRVHIPSLPELIGNMQATGSSSVIFDEDGEYPNSNREYQYRSYVTNTSWFSVRGGYDKLSTEGYEYPTVTYQSSNSKYYKNTKASYTSGYTIPVIYLNGNIPVVYDSTADKYYLDFSVETEYQDYGRHNKGFAVGLKINCSTNIGDTTVKVYADNGTTALATLTVSGFNQFVNVNIPNSALSDLALGNHTLTLKTDTLGIPSSVDIVFTKTADSVPTILSESIGHVSQPINTTYQVYEDDGDSIDVVIKLDGTQIQSITDAPQHSDIPLTLSVSQFSALAYGNHSIVIEATDGANTSTTELPFVKNSEPEIALNVHDLGEVIAPVSIVATYSNADGEEITITADIDGREIPV